ncbi:hypothetical protein DEO72_LG9g2530 [Vigna unguiculata]|uniref:Uncharacterized protein n=1 Tax=Vigna unguiculata TaxID=3917 RepID=A0A4D6N135_VIGUN|nr:hypothetical protein DEO72_LG9g2530 [Vigna unguiculata]
MGWGVLGCRPNTTGLRVAGGMPGGMPGKPKRIRGCYTYCTYPQAWEKVMLELKEVNEEAFKHLIAIPPRQGPTTDEGQNISSQQIVPPNQGQPADEGQNICSQQSVTPSHPSTSAQYVPPTQPPISAQSVPGTQTSISDVGGNVPPAVNCTQGSTSTHAKTTQESIPPLTAHPTATPIPPIPPSRGRPNIRPKLQHRRGRVWKP